MRETAYNCDVCGVHKKEVNHWLVSVEHLQRIWFYPWEAAEWEGALYGDSATVKHLCGQACCQRVLDDFLSRQRAKWEPAKEVEA